MQTVFKIEGGSALKLTTMKYFTPAGRSIHKDDPDDGEESGLAHQDVEEFRTAGGRVVYGGGGIKPDWEIDLPEFTDLQRRLELRGVFFSFAIHYTAYHDVDETFEVTDGVFGEFRDFLVDRKIEVEDGEWTEENLDYARLGITREVFRKLFGAKGAFIATLSEDEEINRVLEMFGKTSTLAEMFDYAKEREKLAEASTGAE